MTILILSINICNPVDLHLRFNRVRCMFKGSMVTRKIQLNRLRYKLIPLLLNILFGLPHPPSAVFFQLGVVQERACLCIQWPKVELIPQNPPRRHCRHLFLAVERMLRDISEFKIDKIGTLAFIPPRCTMFHRQKSRL